MNKIYHKGIKLSLLLILLYLISFSIFGQDTISFNSSLTEINLNIIRETKEQSKHRLLERLIIPDYKTDSIPELKEAEDKSIFNKTIIDLIPLNKIKTIYVPYTISDPGLILSDKDILDLLTGSKLTSMEKIFEFHMSPWITLRINIAEDEKVYLKLMRDRSTGFIILNDGQAYGFILNK